MAETLLAAVQDRLALLGMELEEEKRRLIHTALWALAAFVTGVMTLMMGSVAVICVCWETARHAAVLGVAGFHAALLLVAVIGLRRMLRRRSRLFSASLERLEEDRRSARKLR